MKKSNGIKGNNIFNNKMVNNKMVNNKMVNNKIFSLFKKAFDFFLGGRSIEQFIRYLITGFSTFGLEYLIFYLTIKSLEVKGGIPNSVFIPLLNLNLTRQEYITLIANTVSIAIVFWFNYLANRIWSFKSKEKISKQILQYGVLFFANIAISNFVMHTASSMFGISPLISKVFIMVLIVGWNFILYKTIIYKK